MELKIPQQDNQEKIISFIKMKGPSLPVHIAKQTGLSILLAGAFLSSLGDEKTLKISNLKVGGSPLYFLPGQEAMLENFYQYLPGKEKEAFLLLKEKGFLQDSELEPAIRVALRNIKDFALPFVIEDFPNVIFWRYFNLQESEARKIAESKLKPFQASVQPEIKIEKLDTSREESKEKLKEETISKTIEKPLIEIQTKEKKPAKRKINLRFFEEVRNFLIKKDVEFLQELFVDNKEVIGKVRINSDLGKMNFLMIARDKKRITESDFITAYQKAISEKLPCYFLSKADLAKKNFTFLEEYKNLIKADKL